MDPVIARKPPTLHSKVAKVNEADPWKIDEVTEPSSGWPGDPHLKMKGFEFDDPKHFTRSGGKFVFVHAISIYALLELFDGSTLVWSWSAAGSDVVGG